MTPPPLSTLREQLNSLILSMIADGLVKNKFFELQSMKENCGRDFVIRTIASYSSAANDLFTQMTYQLNMNVAAFYDVMVCAQDLLERSNSIGAVHVSIAATDIFNECHAHDKKSCVDALRTAKAEFERLDVKLESIVKLEQEIIESEDRQDQEAWEIIESEDRQDMEAWEIIESEDRLDTEAQDRI